MEFAVLYIMCGPRQQGCLFFTKNYLNFLDINHFLYWMVKLTIAKKSNIFYNVYYENTNVYYR
jgi:hypothetical protein